MSDKETRTVYRSAISELTWEFGMKNTCSQFIGLITLGWSVISSLTVTIALKSSFYVSRFDSGNPAKLEVSNFQRAIFKLKIQNSKFVLALDSKVLKLGGSLFQNWTLQLYLKEMGGQTLGEDVSYTGVLARRRIT